MGILLHRLNTDFDSLSAQKECSKSELRRVSVVVLSFGGGECAQEISECLFDASLSVMTETVSKPWFAFRFVFHVLSEM